jgi:hypothetical protein
VVPRPARFVAEDAVQLLAKGRGGIEAMESMTDEELLAISTAVTGE